MYSILVQLTYIFTAHNCYHTGACKIQVKMMYLSWNKQIIYRIYLHAHVHVKRAHPSTSHREHCHGMSPSLQQAHHHSPQGSPFQHHNSTSIRPNIKTTMTTKQKNSMTSYRTSLIRHRRRTFLLYKETGMQKSAGMLVDELARHLWTLLQ